jgi:hypothetical protein
MNGPKLVQGHQFEIFKFHLTNSNNVCADAGLLLAVAFEGLFGRVRDDLMVRLPTVLFGTGQIATFFKLETNEGRFIGIMSGSSTPSRKDHHWGKRKLKRDQ